MLNKLFVYMILACASILRAATPEELAAIARADFSERESARVVVKATNQTAFITAFWLACDLVDESGYTAANPLPVYDWPTMKKNILSLMYYCDKAGLTTDQKANIIAAISAVKVLADEPGVDTSVVKPKP